jgi:hypothetical protein
MKGGWVCHVNERWKDRIKEKRKGSVKDWNEKFEGGKKGKVK